MTDQLEPADIMRRVEALVLTARLNAKRGYGWTANPWVCAVSFTAHRQNIDSMEARK